MDKGPLNSIGSRFTERILQRSQPHLLIIAADVTDYPRIAILGQRVYFGREVREDFLRGDFVFHSLLFIKLIFHLMGLSFWKLALAVVNRRLSSLL